MPHKILLSVEAILGDKIEDTAKSACDLAKQLNVDGCVFYCNEYWKVLCLPSGQIFKMQTIEPYLQFSFADGQWVKL